MKNKLLIAVVAVLSLLLAAFSTSKRVVGTDMDPSILAGDRVWVSPWASPLPGDVILLQDPLDPQASVLRRVLAIGGQTIRYDEGSIRVGSRRLRKQAMGDADEHLVAQETLWAKKPARGHQWLTQQVAYPASRWSAEAVTVPEDHLYLLADNRDRAIDSRWWGTIPVEAVHGVVRFRFGEKHKWRPDWEWTVGTAPIGE